MGGIYVVHLHGAARLSRRLFMLRAAHCPPLPRITHRDAPSTSNVGHRPRRASRESARWPLIPLVIEQYVNFIPRLLMCDQRQYAVQR